MMNACDSVTEADILDQVVESGESGISPEVARAILGLKFNPQAVQRMNELAEKNRQGTLTADERAVLEKYLRVGNFLNLLQAKARLSLAAPPASAP
jgi:hypothetical protein